MGKNINIMDTMIEDLKGKDVNINLDFFTDKKIKNFTKTSFEWHLNEILEITKRDNIYIVDYVDKSVGVSIIS